MSAGFHRPLLSHLTRHDSLTALSLEPFFLSEGGVLLGNFLTGNMSLQDLSLGLTGGKPAVWEELGLKLAKHPGLTQANFENTVLNNENCYGLLTLASNYYKTGIVFPEMRLQDEIYLDMELREKYQALIERLKDTPERRFIDERLSEAGLLDLVTNALNGLHSSQEITPSASLHDSVGPRAKLAEGTVRMVGRLIDRTLNEAQAADRSLERNPRTDSEIKQKARNLLAYLIRTENSPAILNSEVYRMLPKIYRDNWEYLENKLSLLKLNLENRHPDKKQSIAYFLLNKVYESNDAKAFQLLMNPAVDVYGLTTGVQEGFFLKVSRDNNQDKLPLREILLEYVIQDNEAMKKVKEGLQAHYPTLIRCYEALIGCYEALNEHLERYAKILHRRIDVTDSISQCIAKLKSIMVLVWKEDTAAKRPEEFAAIRGHFQESILSILVTKEEIRPSSDKFEAARAGLLAMIKVSKKAEKGRFMTSNLHPKVLEISEATIEELWKIQNQLNNQYKGEADKYKEKYEAVTEEQTELKEKLSQTELRCEEKVSKITREMQAQQARVQADQARVQAERARVQAEQARVQAERAEIEARVEARVQAEQAEMRKRIQELESLFRARMGLPDNEATEPAPETAGSSAQFFSGPR